MPWWLEIVVVWLLVSPVVGVAVGLCIARAARIAGEREGTAAPRSRGPAPRYVGHPVVDDDAVPVVVPEGTADVVPFPSRALDDVLHLRLARAEV